MASKFSAAAFRTPEGARGGRGAWAGGEGEGGERARGAQNTGSRAWNTARTEDGVLCETNDLREDELDTELRPHRVAEFVEEHGSAHAQVLAVVVVRESEHDCEHAQGELVACDQRRDADERSASSDAHLRRHVIHEPRNQREQRVAHGRVARGAASLLANLREAAHLLGEVLPDERLVVDDEGRQQRENHLARALESGSHTAGDDG